MSVKVGMTASRAALAAVLGLLFFAARPAAAQINLGPVTLGSPNDPAHLALGAGVFDVKPSTHPDSKSAGELRGEYRFGDVLSIISPFVGASVTSDGATYVYGGFGFDINFGRNWVLNPNFAVGNFGPGSGTKLGSSIEFRSGLELDYRFWDQSRIGLAVQHMSNAGISQRNPGEESITVIYAVPLPGWP
jgi:lipid A 3-O-deacylase